MPLSTIFSYIVPEIMLLSNKKQTLYIVPENNIFRGPRQFVTELNVIFWRERKHIN
jgi:hypothetical protein